MARPAAEDDLRHGRWTGWGFDTHLAHDVHGATLGLVGYGRIARAVAARAAGFDMEVLHTTRTDTGLPGYVASLGDLLERSDIVSLHVPLTESTHHLIGAAELALHEADRRRWSTRPGARWSTRTRWSTPSKAGTIFGAGLDVFEGEPTGQPPPADRPPHHPAAPHRQRHRRHPYPHGPVGLPGGVRRAGRAHAAEPGLT